MHQVIYPWNQQAFTYPLRCCMSPDSSVGKQIDGTLIKFLAPSPSLSYPLTSLNSQHWISDTSRPALANAYSADEMAKTQQLSLGHKCFSCTV